jgi:hypothetical protein
MYVNTEMQRTKPSVKDGITLYVPSATDYPFTLFVGSVLNEESWNYSVNSRVLEEH